MSDNQLEELHKPALIALFQTCWDYIKFYQDLLLKTLLGYTAITGAVMAFWVTHPDFKLAVWGLILPIILGISIALFCSYTIWKKWPETNDECIQSILEDLGLHDYGGPSSESYIFMLWLVGIISVLISFICAGLIWIYN